MGQQLALLLLALAVLSSFCMWPALDYPFYDAAKWLLCCITVAYFGYQFNCLWRWQLAFWLNGKGEGQFVGGDSFSVADPVLVTPWIISFRCRQQNGWRQLYLFRDMFSDSDYRHLCRLLLQRQAPYSG